MSQLQYNSNMEPSNIIDCFFCNVKLDYVRGKDAEQQSNNSLLMSPAESKARFPFKRNRLRCVRCVNENRKKRKRLRWQAANHGCHCFDRALLLA